ncbi:MAG: peptidyl-prolyl cis-trans isomerase [Maribacter sp.]
MFLKKSKTLIHSFTFSLALIVFTSCGSFLKDADENAPIARVGESYLYKEDIGPLLYDGMTKGDSTTIVTNFINNWASKQLLLSKAKINLPEDELAEYNALVADYRTDLYTRAYKDALVRQAADSMVTETQMKRFYEREKENFRLQERVVKIRFIQLPKRFLNKGEVIKRLKRFEKNDVTYLDSVGVQFNKLNFNDSIWVSASRVAAEIPPLTPENQDKYLKNSQFFELEDALGVYLAKVTGVLQVNDVAPLSFIEPTIKQVLINRRKLNYIRQLETDVIDEAIKKNEFEVYEQQD